MMVSRETKFVSAYPQLYRLGDRRRVSSHA
jgi:hypothetical protein